jgi:hypothetical protein
VSWWRGSRRFRLWLALLAPAGAVAGLIAGVIATLSEPSEPGAGVSQWASDVDGSTGFGDWLFSSSLLALFVAVPLTVVTLVVEYILLVRRTSGARLRRLGQGRDHAHDQAGDRPGRGEQREPQPEPAAAPPPRHQPDHGHEGRQDPELPGELRHQVQGVGSVRRVRCGPRYTPPPATDPKDAAFSRR